MTRVTWGKYIFGSWNDTQSECPVQNGAPRILSKKSNHKVPDQGGAWAAKIYAGGSLVVNLTVFLDIFISCQRSMGTGILSAFDKSKKTVFQQKEYEQ